MLIAVAVVGVAMLVMLVWFVVSPGVSMAVPVLDSVAAGAGRRVAVPCSWLAVEMKEAREQHDSVEALAKSRGKVFMNGNLMRMATYCQTHNHQDQNGCGICLEAISLRRLMELISLTLSHDSLTMSQMQSWHSLQG